MLRLLSRINPHQSTRKVLCQRQILFGGKVPLRLAPHFVVRRVVRQVLIFAHFSNATFKPLLGHVIIAKPLNLRLAAILKRLFESFFCLWGVLNLISNLEHFWNIIKNIKRKLRTTGNLFLIVTPPIIS